MSKKEEASKVKIPLKEILMPLGVFLGLILLLLIPQFRQISMKMYDLFLHIKPSVTEDKRFILASIDDSTIIELKVYPLTRNFIGDGIITFSEFGASNVAVDSEFIDISPRGVQESYLKNTIPSYFDQTFNGLNDEMEQFILGILEGQIPRDYALDLLRDLEDNFGSRKGELYNLVLGIVRDNDHYLGAASRFNGSVHMTVTPAEDETNSTQVQEDMEALLRSQIALKNIVFKEPHPFQVKEFINPAILPVMSGARGAGSVFQFVDPDGVRRRVDLVFQFKDMFFPQMSFAALLELLGDPAIEVYSNRIILKDALHPERGRGDITIPLAEDGRMLLHWPNKLFKDSFKQLPYIKALRYKELMQDLNLKLIEMNKFYWVELYEKDKPLLSYFQAGEDALQEGFETGSEEARVTYRESRKAFILAAQEFLSGEYRGMIKNFYEAELESSDPDSRANITDIMAQIDPFFDSSLDILAKIKTLQQELSETLGGAFVIIGYTSQSTTDIGVNPFEGQYMNVGTMATVPNTILSGQFLDDRPIWWSLIFVFPALMLLPYLVINKLTPGRSFLLGGSLLAGYFLVFLLIFIFTGVYYDIWSVIIGIMVTFIMSIFTSFRKSNSQKAFIKNAFGQYLSEEVIEELLQDPEKLKLGGESRVMTAIFTDVKGFSTISEKITPEELVTLLNEYLSVMSDIMIEEKGTIDKYEGDAIIGFFGAPAHVPDHAIRACRSAIRMKKAELELNNHFMAQGMTPNKLFTRVGINTGEMVVGNMGTQKKKNYTMMGNAVNLAARLEGVNKQYQTWTLISDTTKNDLGDEFLVRKLDRVRVVGVSTPLRLYELIDEMVLTEPLILERIEMFHSGLELYENREFEKAKRQFLETLRHSPWDGPTQIYLKRCQAYIVSPPAESWDGVMNMTSK